MASFKLSSLLLLSLKKLMNVILLPMIAQGSHVNNAISPVPSAAQLRTMRKGSTDHLAINIDSESDNLINKGETDIDKGFYLITYFFL